MLIIQFASVSEESARWLGVLTYTFDTSATIFFLNLTSLLASL